MINHRRMQFPAIVTCTLLSLASHQETVSCVFESACTDRSKDTPGPATVAAEVSEGVTVGWVPLSVIDVLCSVHVFSNLCAHRQKGGGVRTGAWHSSSRGVSAVDSGAGAPCDGEGRPLRSYPPAYYSESQLLVCCSITGGLQTFLARCLDARLWNERPWENGWYGCMYLASSVSQSCDPVHSMTSAQSSDTYLSRRNSHQINNSNKKTQHLQPAFYNE